MIENYRGFCIRPLSNSYELDKKTIDNLLDRVIKNNLINDNDVQLTITAYNASTNMLLFLIFKNNYYFNIRYLQIINVNYNYKLTLNINRLNFPILISKSSMVGFLIFKLCININNHKLVGKECIMIGKRLKTEKCVESIKYTISEFNFRNNIQLKKDYINPHFKNVNLLDLHKKFNALNKNKKSRNFFLSKCNNTAKGFNTRLNTHIIIKDKWAINFRNLYTQILSVYITKIDLTLTTYKSSKLFTELCVFITRNKWILSNNIREIFNINFFFMKLIHKLLQISGENGIPSSIYTFLIFFPEMLEKNIIPFVNMIEPESFYYYYDIQFSDNDPLFGQIKKKIDELLKNITM
jgi:hypothetical protein